MNKTKSISTKDLAISAMSISIVFVSCFFVNIKLPISVNGGLIHLGNIALFTVAMLLGARHGMIAGSFGMALFDIAAGLAPWAPGTFIIRGISGYALGYIYEKRLNSKHKLYYTVLAVIIPSLFMIFGYYLYESIIYGNWIVPLTSIYGDIVQSIIGYAVAIPLYETLSRISIFNKVAKRNTH